MTTVKICGLSEPKTLNAAIDAGARYVGFVFYPPSPRHVEIDTAKELALQIPTGVRAVGLFVDPTDEQLTNTLGKVQLDMIQLHGDETPARLAEIKASTAMPIMKAIRISNKSDLAQIAEFEAVADWLLFDAKVDGEQGGTGHSFDWNILKSLTFSKPWMLSGGLTPENISQALSILSPNALDVSSGVESARGIKDEAKIKAFIEATKAAI
jgi:phosphoribosylanthranilate isomerase